ncbi:MAG: hypothetical protein E7064_08045 [Spirochaetaceae bacterium]|nr:hypothetical protein [Spirochaetaceae bacterium]
MQENKESFNYNYSSINKEEVERIRNKYIRTQESDLDELRKIDAKVSNTSTYISIFIGIIGVLVFGTGLSLVLSFNKFILGIIVSFFGLIIMGTGYLANKLVLNKMKQKYAPRILELSERLLKE